LSIIGFVDSNMNIEVFVYTINPKSKFHCLTMFPSVFHIAYHFTFIYKINFFTS